MGTGHPAPPPTSSVALGKLLEVTMVQFPKLANEDTTAYFKCLLHEAEPGKRYLDFISGHYILDKPDSTGTSVAA